MTSYFNFDNNYIDKEWDLYLANGISELRKEFLLEQIKKHIEFCIYDISYFGVCEIESNDGMLFFTIYIDEHLTFHSINNRETFYFQEKVTAYADKTLRIGNYILSPSNDGLDVENVHRTIIWNDRLNYYIEYLNYICELSDLYSELDRIPQVITKYIMNGDNSNLINMINMYKNFHTDLMTMSTKFTNHLTYIRSMPTVSDILCAILPKDVVTYIIVPYMWYAYMECKDCN